MSRSSKRSGDVAPPVLDGRLKEAIELALKELAPRSGDPATIRESVTRLVVAVASRRPDASASNLKSSVVRMLIATEPEVEPPPTPKGRSRRS